jgi:preprotein translocase subunit SecE
MVGLAIYKPNQGYWTRVISAVGAAVLVLAFVAWLWDELSQIGNESTRSIVQISTVVILILGAGIGLFFIMNKVRIVDFYIATDSEMRKVNWPTRREIIGSTWVVVIGTLIMAGLLWVVNLGFFYVFQQIGIIETG